MARPTSFEAMQRAVQRPMMAIQRVLPSMEGGLGTVTFASNDMRDLTNAPSHWSGMKKMYSMPGADISATGGLNCIFCALYRLHHGEPYEYHTGAIASWHLPENLTVAAFFGDGIANQVVTTASLW